MNLPFFVFPQQERNRAALARFPRVSAERIRREVLAAGEHGYVLSSNVVCEGTGGIAVPILDEDGRPVAALGALALAARLVARQAMLASFLRGEASLIEASLRRRHVTDAAGTSKPAESAHVGA